VICIQSSVGCKPLTSIGFLVDISLVVVATFAVVAIFVVRDGCVAIFFVVVDDKDVVVVFLNDFVVVTDDGDNGDNDDVDGDNDDADDDFVVVFGFLVFFKVSES